MPDSDLIRRTIEGEREAYGELALRHGPGLLAFLRRLVRDADEAEDLAQEALLRAYRSLGNFQAGRPFAPWLYRIAANLATDALRRRGKTLSLDQLEEEGAAFADDRKAPPLEQLVSRELAERMRGALEHLPPATAALLELRYGDGLQVQQIAEVLGKQPGAVAVMIHRARQKLREAVFGSRNDGREGDEV